MDLARPSGRCVSKELVPDWGKADLEKLVQNLTDQNWEAELASLSGLEG